MTDNRDDTDKHGAKRPDPAIAERALAEAADRKRVVDGLPTEPEQGGPKGREPVRYGDWEKDGIAYDF